MGKQKTNTLEAEPKKVRSSEIEKSKWSPIIPPRTIEPTVDNAEIGFASPAAAAAGDEVLTQNGTSVVEDAAAIKIQANIRGFLTRKHLKQTDQQHAKQQQEGGDELVVEVQPNTLSEPPPNDIVVSADVSNEG